MVEKVVETLGFWSIGHSSYGQQNTRNRHESQSRQFSGGKSGSNLLSSKDMLSVNLMQNSTFGSQHHGPRSALLGQDNNHITEDSHSSQSESTCLSQIQRELNARFHEEAFSNFKLTFCDGVCWLLNFHLRMMQVDRLSPSVELNNIDLLHIVIVCDETTLTRQHAKQQSEHHQAAQDVSMDDVYAMVKLQKQVISENSIKQSSTIFDSDDGGALIADIKESLGEEKEELKQMSRQAMRQRTVFINFEMSESSTTEETIRELYLAASQFGTLGKFTNTNQDSVKHDLQRAYQEFLKERITVHGTAEEQSFIEHGNFQQFFLEPGLNPVAVLISVDFSERKLRGDKWQRIQDAIFNLVDCMRQKDFIGLNISSKLYTGTTKPSVIQVLLEHEAALKSFYLERADQNKTSSKIQNTEQRQFRQSQYEVRRQRKRMKKCVAVWQLLYDFLVLSLFTVLYSFFLKGDCYASQAYVHPVSQDYSGRVLSVRHLYEVVVILQVLVSLLGVVRGLYQLYIRGKFSRQWAKKCKQPLIYVQVISNFCFLAILFARFSYVGKVCSCDFQEAYSQSGQSMDQSVTFFDTCLDVEGDFFYYYTLLHLLALCVILLVLMFLTLRTMCCPKQKLRIVREQTLQNFERQQTTHSTYMTDVHVDTYGFKRAVQTYSRNPLMNDTPSDSVLHNSTEMFQGSSQSWPKILDSQVPYRGAVHPSKTIVEKYRGIGDTASQLAASQEKPSSLNSHMSSFEH